MELLERELLDREVLEVKLERFELVEELDCAWLEDDWLPTGVAVKLTTASS